MTPWQLIVTSIISSVIASALTGVITYWLTRRQFISQRWWERKADTYSRIIEAAWSLYDFYGTHFDASVNIGRDLPPEQQEALQAKRNIGREEIGKAAVTGEFLASKETAARLKEYLTRPKERFEQGNWAGEIDYDCGRTKELLDDLIVLARKDLEIRSR